MLFKVLSELNMQHMVQKQDKTTIIYENGECEKINENVFMKMEFGKREDQRIRTKFWATNNLPCDAVLGSKFLWKNSVIINMDDSAMNLGSNYLKLNNYEINKEPDVQICKNARLLTMREQIIELVREQHIKNHKLGLISIVEMEIKLDSVQLVQLKDY